MEIKTFRAKSMQQALDMVRRELGPEATVLHTRELNAGLLGRLFVGRQYEIAASCDAQVASHFESSAATNRVELALAAAMPMPDRLEEFNYRDQYRETFRHDGGAELDELHFRAQQLHQQFDDSPYHQLSEALFQVYTDLIEADVEEQVAQELLDHLRTNTTVNLNDPLALRAELLHLVESQLRVTGSLQPSQGAGRVVALVGPTGVGKTTTIAKLAANYRLRENRSVGLITVDTYRIAAVEQLRTYADIIDLPMEVVSTPREMREAVSRMQSLDLVLMDTAGRSPRDQVRIQELKAMLAEARPAEVHLVLSAVGGTKSLVTTAQRFSAVGTTALIVTKLDEATGLGNLLSLTRECSLPVSYLTDGQNVPDDIQVATPRDLARQILAVH
jgi:flagellar biosynthesis protein FlhF